MATSADDLKALFCEALDRPPGPQRAAYLDDACRDAAALRAQVEELLAAHDRAGRFLAAGPGGTAAATGVVSAPAGTFETLDFDPSAAPVPDVPATVLATDPTEAPHTLTHEAAPRRPVVTEGPGTCIGPYKLLQRIGEGGMGVVYMAEQERPVRRRVALKIIKAGMDSAQVVARFEAERQALALMEHPHIARVLDAGQTDAGRPFFVMELVHGVPITAYCDQARLSPQARLELFIPVCQAVQHAHQKGIVHRDIKPSNVLVTLIDGRPVPKVIDFGVAKATSQRLTERTLFTQFGAVVGTLEYMSPEQAELSGLDVDTRADVYSLGVLLYELLTGTTPLERARLREAGFAEILRRIREEEPPRPSTRLSSCERLASIAATRGVEPERLTRLVRGELDWLVMKALDKDRNRRYETANGLARDVQRYLAGEAIEACPPSAAYRLRKLAGRHRAALATAAAFAGLLIVGAAVSAVLAVRASRAERAARAAERVARDDRDRALRAEAAARTEVDKATAVNDFLTQDLLTQAEPENNAAVDHVTLLEVLDRAAAKVGERFAGRPELEEALRATIATTYHGLGAWEQAEAQWRAVNDSGRRRLGPDAPEVLYSDGELGHILEHRGQPAEAVRRLEAASEGLSRALGPDHPDTLASRNRLAQAYLAAGRATEAIRLSEATIKTRESKLGPDHPETPVSRGGLAQAYLAAGRATEAISLLEATLKACESKLGPGHPDTLVSRNNLARAYLAAGRVTEALPLLEANRHASESKLGPDHPGTLAGHNGLAQAYLAAGRATEAIRLYEATLKTRESKLGPDHPETSVSRGGLALAYLAAGRATEAISLLEATLKASESKLGPDHPDTATTAHNLGHALQGSRPDRAEALFRKALAHYRKAQGAEGPNTLELSRDLAGVLASTGRAPEAVALLEPLLRTQESRLGATHRDTIRTRGVLAAAYASVGRHAEAEPLLRDQLEYDLRRFGPDDPRTNNAVAQLGMSLLSLEKWSEAEPLLRECLRVRAAKAPDLWATFNTRSQLGGSLLGQGRYAEAEPLIVSGYEGLKAREATMIPLARPRLAEAAARVVALYRAWGKPDQAEAWVRKIGLPDLPADVFARP